MENKTLYNAICGIDESRLDEFEKNIKSIKNGVRIVKLIAAVSACFVVVAAVCFAFSEDSGPTMLPVERGKITAGQSSAGGISVQEKSEQKTETENINMTLNKTSETKIENTSSSSKEISEKSENVKKTKTETIAESENKGGNTPEELNDTRNGTDGGNYKVFKPGEDKFEPIDEMTLENRFCAFNYNGFSYYPAPDGELTSDDYEPDKLASVKAEHWELRSANADDDTSGVVYYARIDIYKLKGVETNEAVACVISFNGETKEYRYNATKINYPS